MTRASLAICLSWALPFGIMVLLVARRRYLDWRYDRESELLEDDFCRRIERRQEERARESTVARKAPVAVSSSGELIER